MVPLNAEFFHVKNNQNPQISVHWKIFAKQKTKLAFLPIRRFFHQSWIHDHYGEFSLKVEKLKIPFLDGLCQKMTSYDNQKRVFKNWRLGIFRNPRWPPPLLKFFKMPISLVLIGKDS